jgi:hypothetical protein
MPLDTPTQPAFGRETFIHEIKELAENLAYDDLYTMNTQSGTQWDGFRHVNIVCAKTDACADEVFSLPICRQEVSTMA